MPVFTPGRRWQPAFLPFKRDPFGTRVLNSVERVTKGPLFGCRMCGNCLLQETAFICPMASSKHDADIGTVKYVIPHFYISVSPPKQGQKIASETYQRFVFFSCLFAFFM